MDLSELKGSNPCRPLHLCIVSAVTEDRELVLLEEYSSTVDGLVLRPPMFQPKKDRMIGGGIGCLKREAGMEADRVQPVDVYGSDLICGARTRYCMTFAQDVRWSGYNGRCKVRLIPLDDVEHEIGRLAFDGEMLAGCMVDLTCYLAARVAIECDREDGKYVRDMVGRRASVGLVEDVGEVVKGTFLGLLPVEGEEMVALGEMVTATSGVLVPGVRLFPSTRLVILEELETKGRG